jgi:tetratricopeptide (TPR) repeat protein
MAFQKARALREAEKSVAQGKIAQAIKLYQDIFDNDASDLSLLNTIGDLNVRDRNITEGLKQFHRLAEAYVREGFNLKAVAIYRKISKIDPNSVGTLLKLAELYQLQGLTREAREQYLQAAEFFKKRNLAERVLEVLRKLVLLDPANLNFHNRLAAECERMGKWEEASQAYLEAAEILLRHNDQGAAETALNKAAELNPKNGSIPILRAQVAIAREQPEEAEKIVNSLPELQASPVGKRLLIDSYLGSRKLPEAKKLALEVFQANTTDFAPLSSVSALLVDEGHIDEAYELLAGVAGLLVSQNNAGPLIEALRRIWTKSPQHIPTLELIHGLCERTADELTLPEVLESLGRAHEQAGDFVKAEAAYLKLIAREPDNENHRALLNSVQQKLGREVSPTALSAREMALAREEEEPDARPEDVDAKQKAMVHEALENSDLYARYNLTEKAINELEKVLRIYPDQGELHRRILEISRKGYPERGAMAAAELARIYTESGDHETASKYQAIASAKDALPEIPLPPLPSSNKVEEPATPPPTPPEGPEPGIPTEFPIPAVAPEEPAAAAPSADEVPFEPTPADAPADSPPPAVVTEEAVELDLTGDLEAIGDTGVEVPVPAGPEPTSAPRELVEPPTAPEQEAIPDDLQEGRTEVEFYFANGFVDEARQALSVLEEKYPGSPFLAELHQRLDAGAAGAAPEQPQAQVASTDDVATAAPAAEFEIIDEAHVPEWQTETAQAEPEVASPSEPLPAPPPPVREPQARSQAVELAGPPPVPTTKGPVAAEDGMKMLGDLAGDLASSVEALTASTDAPATPPAAAAPQGVAQLSDLLTEMEEPGTAATGKDDPETHYNLGVAFREMGLLDEAIGEFQKVAKAGRQGKFPPHLLQACSLLAICFMEKKMPAIAVRWYVRALETPGLDEEALLALQYDLGVAYEQAGDSRHALERFTEVYSQNIDFRDVAEKIRELQPKA